jgi:hypothetical protein
MSDRTSSDSLAAGEKVLPYRWSWPDPLRFFATQGRSFRRTYLEGQDCQVFPRNIPGGMKSPSLPKKWINNMIGARESRRRRSRRESLGSFCNDALERRPFLRGFWRKCRHWQQRTCATLRDVLASDFRFHLPARPFGQRRARFDPRLSCYGA